MKKVINLTYHQCFKNRPEHRKREMVKCQNVEWGSNQ